METAIKIFRNPQFGEIRTTEENGKPLFVANDVANALGYTNPQKAIRDHCKGVNELFTPTNGGMQNQKFIPESDVYRLVMRSKLPQAEQFQDWVVEEVLPSIRKNGGYMVARTGETAEEIMARAILLAKETIDRQSTQLKEQAPKVLFADAVATSDRSVLVAELAKVISQNGFEIGQNRLFNWLRANGYLCNRGEYYNQPTQRAMDMGLFEIKKTSITKPDGTVLVSATSKVTGKGQIYFVNKFLKGNDKGGN